MMVCHGLKKPLQVAFGNGSFTGVCDATTDKGGAGEGFRPHELLEAALGSCLVMVMTKYAAAHGLPLAWATVTVTLDRSDPDVAAYGCEVSLEGNLTNAQRQKILRAARVCPVRRTLGCRTVVTESVRR
ncbi:OsmC family peroxiredoxin [Desulfovibrio aerotolerans]|uniref:OsmC family peroxiredoxin n=1 Tax=Solidesulfovibrio aerotolerans TaxID=295255 RepID=A0A7C9IJB0_9BACT|nr:OsmC family protein [Solidesulfovibrio aerotolerans]MYL82085.1 OsmC family peroxiredoxin [Solidesulfovibrio aerotolerans]